MKIQHKPKVLAQRKNNGNVLLYLHDNFKNNH